MHNYRIVSHVFIRGRHLPFFKHYQSSSLLTNFTNSLGGFECRDVVSRHNHNGILGNVTCSLFRALLHDKTTEATKITFSPFSSDSFTSTIKLGSQERPQDCGTLFFGILNQSQGKLEGIEYRCPYFISVNLYLIFLFLLFAAIPEFNSCCK